MRLPKTIKIYGDTSFRDKNCSYEETEQKDLFGRLKEKYPELRILAVHPKIEGNRNGKQITKDQEMGSLNTGASDIIIPGSPSFVCELKRKDHTQSKITKHQITYLETAQSMGSFACIALGADAVIAAIDDWLRIYYNK